jgi:hypothetical protein
MCISFLLRRARESLLELKTNSFVGHGRTRGKELKRKKKCYPYIILFNNNIFVVRRYSARSGFLEKEIKKRFRVRVDGVTKMSSTGFLFVFQN